MLNASIVYRFLSLPGSRLAQDFGCLEVQWVRPTGGGDDIGNQRFQPAVVVVELPELSDHFAVRPPRWATFSIQLQATRCHQRYHQFTAPLAGILAILPDCI
ncbi:MAG: hypothetical protein QOF25_503 [Mycobacterium sp.]|nr:hypothetical protein [Mycobacterium sp.]